MTRIKTAVALFAGLVFAAVSVAAQAQVASPNETARYLAGFEPEAGSALAKFAKDANWQQHQRSFETAWKELDKRQISKIIPWTDENLKSPARPLFYMFSGPDFLYANAFFPNATTYLMAGLEPVGPIPQVNDRSRYSLANLRASLQTILNISYFITADMSSRLHHGDLKGTLPILYTFLARSGKTIQDVELVSVDKDGKVAPTPQGPAARNAPRADQGVKIVFTSEGGRSQTLYYFSTDLSDSGTKASGFLKFAEKLGAGDALVKSASYLLHGGNFARVRDFLLNNAQTIAQDDTGIPVRFFKKEDWLLKPYGAYLGPIPIFEGMYQPQMQVLFRQNKVPKLDFGVGYRWRGFDSNFVVAVKKNIVAQQKAD